MEEIIQTIIQKHFSEILLKTEKMTTGLINEVYKIELSDKKVILRMNARQTNMKGTEFNIPLFQKVGVKVPELLFSDYSMSNVPFAYQILTIIEGTDLGLVIEKLSDEELQSLASDISDVIDRVSTIQSVSKFGLLCEGNINDMHENWEAYLNSYLEEGISRAEKTKVIEKDIIDFVKTLPEKYSKYFNEIQPLPYYEDMCSKNVMIWNGKFNGLVDLDYISFGDYLDAIGRIYASWHSKEYGQKYLSYLYQIRKLSEEQKKMVKVYGLMHKFNWSSENGVQFNSNTNAVVDWESAENDNRVLRDMMSNI